MKEVRTITRRAGCATVATAVLVGVLALAAYQRQDYRPRFARTAGELIAVRDSLPLAGGEAGAPVTEVTLVSDTGLEVRARIRSVGHNDGVRRPAMIVLGGYKLGSGVVEVPDTTGGVVLASLEYPFDLRDRPRGAAWAREALRIRGQMVETPSAVLLLAQYLYVRGDVDPDRVSILGASLGAPFAVAAAATDRRLAGVVLLDGGGDIGRLMEGVLEREVPRWAVRPLAEVTALLLAPLEPTRYAEALAPRPLLMLNAEGDEAIPRASALALYHAARRPKQIAWRATGHVALSEEDVIEDLMDETLVWMRKQGLR